jgi:hypothetical protein
MGTRTYKGPLVICPLFPLPMMFTLGKQNDDELSSGLRIIYNKTKYIHTLSYIYIVIFYIIYIYVKFNQLIWVAHDSKHLTNENPISVVRKNPPGRRAAVQVHGVSEVAIRRGPGPRLECPIFLGECWWILWKMLVTMLCVFHVGYAGKCSMICSAPCSQWLAHGGTIQNWRVSWRWIPHDYIL